MNHAGFSFCARISKKNCCLNINNNKNKIREWWELREKIEHKQKMKKKKKKKKEN